MRSRCSPCVCLCIPLSLLGNGSVKVLLSLLGNGYVFYAVRVVSKGNRRLVLLRTSCLILEELFIFPTDCVYPVSYDYHNKQRLFPFRALIGWSSLWSRSVFSQRQAGTKVINIISIKGLR
jgi:hypothetical protein